MKNLFDHSMQSRLKFWKKPNSDSIEEKPLSRPASVPLHSTFPTSILRDFIDSVTKRESPIVLDLGQVIGSNIEYFLNFGIKIYLEDFLSAYVKPEYSVLVDDQTVLDEKKFFSENLSYEDNYFDGLICWDIFDYLDPKFAKSVVERTLPRMKSNSFVLAFFHTQKGKESVPVHKYRVVSEARLEHVPFNLNLEVRKIYQTRDINQLFAGYQSQKFYRLKHNVLEVLLKKL